MRILRWVPPTRKRHWITAALLPVTVAGLAACGTTAVGDTAAQVPSQVESGQHAPAAPAVEPPMATDTTTEAPTTTTPPPPPPPQVVRGDGDDVVSVTYGDGPKIVEFSCPHCTGNTVLVSRILNSLSNRVRVDQGFSRRPR